LFGGLATSFIMALLVYPVIFMLWRSRQHKSVAETDSVGVAKQSNV
jgi:hypothetical protein